MRFYHFLASSFPPKSHPAFKFYYILSRVRCGFIHVNSFAIIKYKIFPYKDFFNNIINILRVKVCVSSHRALFFSEYILIYVQFMRVLINNSKSKALFHML